MNSSFTYTVRSHTFAFSVAAGTICASVTPRDRSADLFSNITALAKELLTNSTELLNSNLGRRSRASDIAMAKAKALARIVSAQWPTKSFQQVLEYWLQLVAKGRNNEIGFADQFIFEVQGREFECSYEPCIFDTLEFVKILPCAPLSGWGNQHYSLAIRRSDLMTYGDLVTAAKHIAREHLTKNSIDVSQLQMAV